MKPLKSSYPPSHLLNPAFRYIPAAATDIRETIRRARLQQQRREYVAPQPKIGDLVRVD